jgi:hypothetical protein
MEIAKTDKYSIEVNKAKNRIYLKIVGFWERKEEVPNYLSDWQRAIKEVTKGFTILSDLKEMITPMPEVAELHQNTQVLLVKAGLRKTAELVPSKPIEQSTLKRYAKTSGMRKENFEDRIVAEVWLDT